MDGLTALVDTSVLVRAASATTPARLESWAVSAISVGELEAGVLLALDPATRAERLRRVSAVLGEAPVLDIDRSVAERYGELRAASGRLPSNDLWIAATALAHDLVLVTADAGQARLPLVHTHLVESAIETSTGRRRCGRSSDFGQ